jgi:glycosyltransferase involved in cell wall biosynthesis
MKTLRVEGWRFIPHSYAIVNQWQLLSLLKRKDISLSICDLTYYNPYWRPIRGLFSLDQERALSSIPASETDGVVDGVYRISFPYDFTVSNKNRTFIFGTAEYKRLGDIYFQSSPDIKSLAASQLFSVVTPSRWSREAFLHLGLRDDQVLVVAHGINPTYFSRPCEAAQRALRTHHRISGFVFSNVSAMTANKGIDLLVRAFAAVAEKRPDVRLHLKGNDRLYGSSGLLARTIETLPIRHRSLVVDRLFYLGETISSKQMAEYHQLADVYVSPYRAEGFNLPVLEACACGTPVICTGGGPTDDFMKEGFTRFIDSKLTPTPVPLTENEGFALVPNLDHLIDLMFKVIDDKDWRDEAAIMGARHVAMNFSWDAIVNNLLQVIFR